jgi:hypothetical protein
MRNRVATALDRLPHELNLRGMRHEVEHDPMTCVRCRAEDALSFLHDTITDTWRLAERWTEKPGDFAILMVRGETNLVIPVSEEQWRAFES